MFDRKKWREKLKFIVLSHYSGISPKCNCCGEEEIKFLTIDHIYNNGAKHRREGNFGSTFYRWLRKNNYPEGYQVLCYNCNCGKRANGGVCPHKEIFVDA